MITNDDYEAEYIGDSEPVDSPAEPVEEQEDVQAADYEAEARKQGWKPQEEFDGPSDKWRPAEEFVKRGNEDPRILYSRVTKLDRTLAEERRAREEERRAVEDRFERLNQMNLLALQRQRQQLEAQFSHAKRLAVKDGDEELYNRVEQQEQETRKAWQEEDQWQQQNTQAKPQPAQQQLQPEVSSWIERNPWFNKDQALTEEATAYEEYLARTQPGLSLDERLEKTREHVAAQYPNKFGRRPRTNGAQRQGSPVDSGARQPGQGGVDHGFAQLPNEFKAQFRNFVKEGIFEDTPKARAEYAKYATDPNADRKVN